MDDNKTTAEDYFNAPRRSAIMPQSPYDPYAVEIKQEYPPNIGEIRRAGIPLTGREIFAYGDTIYNPSGGRMTEPLIAHEKVHFKQQDGDPESWWTQYLSDVDFRLEQELAAHRAEYRDFCRAVRNRERRVRFLSEIALRLSGPLYGSKLTHREAMGAIR